MYSEIFYTNTYLLSNYNLEYVEVAKDDEAERDGHEEDRVQSTINQSPAFVLTVQPTREGVFAVRVVCEAHLMTMFSVH